MTQESKWQDLTKELTELLSKQSGDPSEAITAVLKNHSAADIALAIEELPPEHAIRVFDRLDKTMTIDVLAKLEPERTRKILELHPEKLLALIRSLPSRETAALLTDIPAKLNAYLKKNSTSAEVEQDARQRQYYPKGSIGRLMTTQFIRLASGSSIAAGINRIKDTAPNVNIPDDLFVVKEEEHTVRCTLLGVISIKGLLISDPQSRVDEIMTRDVISVPKDIEVTDAAALLSKYKFMSLPVTDADGYLVGVVPADDLIAAVVNRLRRLYSHAVGTDAENMAQLSAFQAAKLRVPWLLGTMLIELVAGMIIAHFDAVLQKIILLTSFMPVISAISGNVGLQAAAITVRALDSSSTPPKNIWAALRKEGLTIILMAVACGLVLGTVGSIWARHIPFGILIGVALTCSMLTAGMMGTLIPTLSKKLGFDPATTAGPFETALFTP